MNTVREVSDQPHWHESLPPEIAAALPAYTKQDAFMPGSLEYAAQELELAQRLVEAGYTCVYGVNEAVRQGIPPAIGFLKKREVRNLYEVYPHVYLGPSASDHYPDDATTPDGVTVFTSNEDFTGMGAWVILEKPVVKHTALPDLPWNLGEIALPQAMERMADTHQIDAATVYGADGA